jgi:hypothetical protein
LGCNELQALGYDSMEPDRPTVMVCHISTRRLTSTTEVRGLAPILGKLGEEKLRKLLKNGRTDVLSTLTEHPVSLSAGGGPNISFH